MQTAIWKVETSIDKLQTSKCNIQHEANMKMQSTKFNLQNAICKLISAKSKWDMQNEICTMHSAKHSLQHLVSKEYFTLQEHLGRPSQKNITSR